VLDEWPLVRLGVAVVLADDRVRVVAEPPGAASALAAVRSQAPDLFVVGAHDGPPAELVGRAMAAAPGLRCIVLVSPGEVPDVRSILTAGARAVVPRNVGFEELRDVVRRVLAGDHVVSPALLQHMFAGDGGALTTEGAPPRDALDGVGTSDAPPVLTSREREIVRLVGAGRSNAEIAAALFVSSATVKTHLAHIYDKLGARSRYDALGRAVALGLLD
jgi:DNA-binding NarL/FixJ family response regulator